MPFIIDNGGYDQAVADRNDVTRVIQEWAQERDARVLSEEWTNPYADNAVGTVYLSDDTQIDIQRVRWESLPGPSDQPRGRAWGRAALLTFNTR